MSSSDDQSKEIEEANKEQQRLLQEQIDQSNAEIEQKRQAVFQERLNILHSQGAPTWSPSTSGGAISNKPTHSTPSKIGTYNNVSQERGR